MLWEHAHRSCSPSSGPLLMRSTCCCQPRAWLCVYRDLSLENYLESLFLCFLCSLRSWIRQLCFPWTAFWLLCFLMPTGVATCTGETWRGSSSPWGSGSVQSR